MLQLLQGENFVSLQKIKVKKIHSLAKLPERQTSGSVGYDMCTVEEIYFPPKEVTLVRTGISIELPKGYHAELYTRSSWGTRGLHLANGVGVIDCDYRGELIFAYFNGSAGKLNVAPGIRIGQMVLRKTHILDVEEVDSLDSTEREYGGFGSTGEI